MVVLVRLDSSCFLVKIAGLTTDQEELQAEILQYSVRKIQFHYCHPGSVVAWFAGLVHLPLAYQKHPSQNHFLPLYCISAELESLHWEALTKFAIWQPA
jgi:hypothetical protein